MEPNLYGLTRRELGEVLQTYGAPAFHAGQVYRWMYARRRFAPREWTDLPQGLRDRLQSDIAVQPGSLTERVVASDGTVKYRVDLPGGGSVESVYMVQRDRATLCISSQVGCALDCDFCLTGKMGFGRHLTPGEIAGQVARIQQDQQLGQRAFNIVFMGMGEPLHNYDGVLGAVALLTDPEGFGISRKRIAVSTSGIVPAIERLAREPLRPRLAVSLNATTDAVRDRLMPINRRYPIARLLEVCATYAQLTRERFTFEYVLLDGVNNTEDDIRRLARMVTATPAKLNLIPFNAVPDWLHYRPPTRERVIAMRDALLSRSVPVSIRWSRGADARAACGQLALLPKAAS
jgi:23S rRNA (adenine2503-C2)-methyltransferase